jgi:predicted Rossmann-fold nucleotide-binding protein
MKIGIIGPNKISGDISERKVLIDKVARIMADSGHEIILTPNKNSLLEYFGRKYIELGGKNVWLVVPLEEEDYKTYLNVDVGEIINCHDWDRQANEFNRQCDIFVCIGYAWGAMKEIACARYFNKKKIYVLNEFISEKLPNELSNNLEYIPISKLHDII